MALAETIEAAFIDACNAELAALKPGNVHRFADGHRMRAADFEAAAIAAAPSLAAPGVRVGRRIPGAVSASIQVTAMNTNLGICLLCAPLAAAAELAAAGDAGPPDLRAALHDTLADLDREDAAEAFAAIRIANPAGLGTADAEDVAAPPTVGLREAMVLAADRDRIANAYATDFAEVFDIGLPALAAARATAASTDLAVSTLHMTLLARFDDSHTARKHGADVARAIRTEAAALEPLWQPVVDSRSFDRLLAFDADLKSRGINPGTTADFVVATVFAGALISELRRIRTAA